MVTDSERQAIVDGEHLKLIPLYYWVSAGFLGVYTLFMVMYFVFIGAAVLSIPLEDASSSGPPEAFGWMFVGIGLVALLIMATFVVFKVLAGFWIGKKRHRVATMIIAGLSCLEFPYGTLAGVLTIVTLARPSVAALYATSGSAPIEPARLPDPPVPPNSTAEESGPVS